MKNRGFKSFTLFLVLFLVVGLVAGCSPYREVEKVSKNLTNYNITAKLDGEMVVSAVEEVDIVNRTEVPLDKVCFNLYGRAFREDAQVKPYTSYNEAKCFPNGKSFGDVEILNVSSEQNRLDFFIVGQDFNALEIVLPQVLEPKDKIVVTIEFRLKLAECTHRLGYINQSVNLGNWFPILAMYEKGEYIITPYYSTGDPFYSDIANYNVNFTYDSNYALASSGVLEDRVESDGFTSVHLQAIAVRDFAITLTACENSKFKNVGKTKVTYVGYDGDENVEFCLDVASKALEFFSDKFGSYPYEKIDVVKAPFVHGGMEYPGLVIISDSITEEFDVAKVIVHEIAHQWWYGVVGNNEITESWLDESLAEYSSVLFFEQHSEYGASYEELISEAFAGYTLYADIVASVDKKLNTSMLLAVNQYAGDYEYSYMIYVKGVLMFDNIRQVVGKEKLIMGFKSYYNKYKFKTAKTDDFIATIQKSTGKDVGGLMDSWLSGKTIIGTI